jgi:polysaccharide export outer membrane protein
VTTLGILWVTCTLATGCHGPQACSPADSAVPRELSKVSLPAYVIEPPDILLLDAIRLVPRPPYHIEPLDGLAIQVSGTPPGADPIAGIYPVDPDGTVSLGVEYGTLRVQGMTLDQAREAIEKYLKGPPAWLKEVRAQVAVAYSRGLQYIRGEHLVRPDGTVSLGNYGSVYVTGMTVPEAKAEVEQHLAWFVVKPEVSLDVLAYNSKVFYIITDGAGFGQQVIRLPVTGNETVLDALAQINGLPAQASKHHIWVARPTPVRPNCGKDEGDQILEVNWNAITQCGQTATNYQILPGDRIYVRADGLITLDNAISKITAPIERLFGVTLLGNSTVRSFAPGAGGGGTGRGGTGTGF